MEEIIVKTTREALIEAEKKSNIWLVAAPHSNTYNQIPARQIAESYHQQAFVDWDKQFEAAAEVVHCEDMRVKRGYLKTVIVNYFKTFKGVLVPGANNRNVIYTKKVSIEDKLEWPHGEAIKIENPHVDKISIVEQLVSFYKKYDWKCKLILNSDLETSELFEDVLLGTITALRKK